SRIPSLERSHHLPHFDLLHPRNPEFCSSWGDCPTSESDDGLALKRCQGKNSIFMLPGHKTRINPSPANRLPPVQVDLPAPRLIRGCGAHGLGQNHVQFAVAVEVREPDA